LGFRSANQAEAAMKMKWEFTKMALMFGGALVVVQTLVGVLEAVARHA
jgi:hypothetical protein